MRMLFAQVTAADVTAPLTGAGVLAIGGFVLKWLMNVVITKLDALGNSVLESNRSLEKALEHNTRATLLMGIAQGDSAQALKAKLAGCPLLPKDAPRSNQVLDDKINQALEELDEREALSKLRKDQA